MLSTGRSGSQSISKIFKKHDQVDAYHEPHYQIIRISTEYEHGVITKEAAKHELFSIYCNSFNYKKGMIYLESEHRLFNLVHLLKEIIPHSKFIWLIRDGRNVVSSTFGRGWYDPKKEFGAKPLVYTIPGIWDYYRLDGSKAGVFSKAEWDRMNIFQKNCWYWSYINESIERQLLEIPREDWIFVKLEELSREISNICEFMKIPADKLDVIVANTATYKVKGFDSWNEDEINDFSTYCGRQLKNWYNVDLK